MRRGNLEPCRNHRPGGRRRRSGAGLDDDGAVSADRVAVTIGTAGRVPRLPGCQESSGTLIGRQIESWACHSRHRHPKPAGSAKTWQIFPPFESASWPGTRHRQDGRPVHHRSSVYGRHRKRWRRFRLRLPPSQHAPGRGRRPGRLAEGRFRTWYGNGNGDVVTISRHPRWNPVCAI